MLEQSQLELSTRKGKQKSISLLAGFAIQGLGLAGLLLMSLMFTEVAPRLRYATFLVGPPPGPRRTPQTDTRPRTERKIPARFVPKTDGLQAPTVIPDRIAMVNAPAPPQWDEMTGSDRNLFVDGSTGTDSDTFLNFRVDHTPAQPPPPQPIPVDVAQEPMRIGGSVAAAKLIHQAKPIYPRLAIQVHIQGVVKLEAIINEAGTIDDLRVLSGHPLLIQAALDAVAQWRYQATLLNGHPVPVITTVEVNFRLGG